MQTLSKLSDKCKKCPHVSECDNKRMVACAMIEWKPNIADATASITMPLAQPMLRIEHPITINMAEKLKKEFYKNMNCMFSRGM